MFVRVAGTTSKTTNETLAISHFYGMEICLITIILGVTNPQFGWDQRPARIVLSRSD
jgi:hypothetical protein